MIDAGGAKGGRWRMAAQRQRQINEKIRARLNLLLYYFLPPPLQSAQAKRRQPYLGPLDEVSVLGLGAAVAMAPL